MGGNEITSLLVPVIIVFVVLGYGYYFLFGRKKMNQQLGIDADDSMYRVYNAYADVNVSAAKQAALAAVGLLFGTIASYRAPRLTVSITRKGIVALGNMENGGGEVIRYTPDNKPSIAIVGDGGTTMSGWSKALERTKIVEITPKQQEGFRLIVPESGANDLVKWASE